MKSREGEWKSRKQLPGMTSAKMTEVAEEVTEIEVVGILEIIEVETMILEVRLKPFLSHVLCLAISNK